MDQVYEEKYHQLETQNWWFLSRRARICSLLKNAPRSAAILDIGCSSGQLLRDLQNMGFTNLTGIDVSETGVQRAKENGFNCMVMDGQEPAFDANSFDIVISSDSLEHMEHDQNAINHWNQLLRPNGIAVIFVPAFMSLWSGHDVVNHHYRRYTVKELKERATKANFQVKQSGYWNFVLFFPIYALRKIKNLFSQEDSMPKDDLQNQGALLNATLQTILKIENSLATVVRFPVGVSAYVILEKGDQ